MGRRSFILSGLCVALYACADDPTPGPPVTIEVDNLQTLSAVIGADPLITAVVTGCSGTPPAMAYADGEPLKSEPAVFLFSATGNGIDPQAYPNGALFFQMLIPGAELAPSTYGLPASFDLEMAVFCHNQWFRSAPFAMLYVPAVASIAPPFNPLRFWASDTEGDLLACVDTRLVLYAEGVTEAESMELGFPCAATTMSEGLGVRRYLWGESLGIAAIDAEPTELAWSRPMLLVGMWSDAVRDPVVLREQGETSELVVLDWDSGDDDAVGPLALAHEPLGPLSRDANNDILVLETELSGDPQTRTYYVERFNDGGTSLSVRSVAHYNWRAPSYIADFDLAGEHIYIAAAPEHEDSFWIEKINLQSNPPTLMWATSPADGWRYPLGESAGRLIVASEEAFVWLDPATGQALSQPFAPDSGNAFLHGVVEQDGSVVMLADATGNAAQGLYIFAPDGTTTLRFRPGAALFRWLAPAWGVGTLVSHYDELHWLHARQDYDALLEP